jgi:hypothetical protein
LLLRLQLLLPGWLGKGRQRTASTRCCTV